MSGVDRVRNHLVPRQIKETATMRKRPAILAVLMSVAALLLAALPVSASAAASPWWQILSGSRPTNLWEPEDEVQELVSAGALTKIEVDGAHAACYAALPFLCTGFPYIGTTPTAANLQTALEAPTVYGAGGVEVEERSSGHFKVSSLGPMAGRWVPPLSVLGKSENARVLTEGGSGRLFVILTNLGDEAVDATSTPLQIIDQLPAGVAAYNVEAFAGVQGKAGTIECGIPSTSQVTCEFEGVLPSYEAIEIEIFASLEGAPPVAGAPGHVSVSGANAPSAGESQTVEMSASPVPFGLERFSAQAEDEGGGATEQGGAHPFQFVNTVQFNSGKQRGATRRATRVDQPAQPRNTRITLPPGLVGNATAVPTCPMAVFLEVPPHNTCANASVVGVASVTVVERAIYGILRIATPIYNLPPKRGEPARFGFVAVTNPVTIDTSVDPDDRYRITGEVSNAPQSVEVLSATISLWGDPGAASHDFSRGENCFLFRPEYPGICGESLSGGETPFLRMPVACDAPLEYPVEAEPWNVPLGSVVERASWLSEPVGGLRGCNHEPFKPKFSLAPTSKAAESPSGLDAEVSMPNEGDKADATAETQFKKAEVTLPEGVTVNPSQAEGLATCSPADYRRERFDSLPGEGCPEASKIGSVKISTPLLEEEAEGALYIAAPYDNPFDSLIALYLVARIPDRGILVKQAGVVRPDPRTGRLVTTFDDVPQVPISSFKLHFRDGPRAPLVTPPACGTYHTVARFTPWSAHDPDNPAPDEVLEKTVPFTIEGGSGGGACPSGSPFDPGFSAGTINNSAGSYSPFDMRLTRNDGEQDLTRFSAKLPPGVVARLAGTAECSDADIARAAARTGAHGGEEELASPSCPAASRIGSVMTGAGVGGSLTWVPGSLYLAGPYKGAPLSVVSIVPAVAGPFDLGTVVIREALRVDRRTAEVEADGSTANPIPRILKGIPLRVRDIRIHVDKPHFTLNPTSCEPLATEATLWGGGSALTPRADSPVGRSARFQAAGCAALKFKPKLNLSLKGATRRTGHPALRAVVTYPAYTQEKRCQALGKRADHLARKAKRAHGQRAKRLVRRAKRARQDAKRCPRTTPPPEANIARAQVGLPHAEFLDQGNLNKVCKQADLRAGTCPKSSIYGHAKAWTPLLDKPLQGPVYLGVGFGYKLPALVADLNGQIRILLVGRIDTTKRNGIRNTFEVVPDAPVSRFVLTMKGGKKYGLLENSEDICKKTQRASALFDAQNGLRLHMRAKIANSCRGGKHHRPRRGHASGRRGPNGQAPGGRL